MDLFLDSAHGVVQMSKRVLQGRRSLRRQMVLVASLSIQEAFPMIYSNGYLLELEVKNLVQISILTLTLQRLEITVNKGQSLFV